MLLDRLGEFRLFRKIGRAFEIQTIAIRICYGGHPQRIADERLSRVNAASSELMIERYRVITEQAQDNIEKGHDLVNAQWILLAVLQPRFEITFQLSFR